MQKGPCGPLRRVDRSVRAYVRRSSITVCVVCAALDALADVASHVALDLLTLAIARQSARRNIPLPMVLAYSVFVERRS